MPTPTTGTAVGDRIEGNAITEAFGGVEREAPPRVSSVKSNVGHMEAAAFHCALLKVILIMRHRAFAPTHDGNSRRRTDWWGGSTG